MSDEDALARELIDAMAPGLLLIETGLPPEWKRAARFVLARERAAAARALRELATWVEENYNAFDNINTNTVWRKLRQRADELEHEEKPR